MGKKILILLILVSFLFSGCASIVGREMFPLTMNSHPDGAKVKVVDERGNSIFQGVTPATVSLKAGESYFHRKAYTITFIKNGYSEQKVVVSASLSGWYWGNIVFGGLVGMLIVDPMTGKMYKLPRKPVTATLQQQTG